MDEDSDIEVIEEVELDNKPSSSNKSEDDEELTDICDDDEDELPDLDDEVVPFSDWANGGRKKAMNPIIPGQSLKSKLTDQYLPITVDDNDSDDSLPSLPPPSPPISSSKRKLPGSAYDNRENKKTFADKESQDIDDFLQEVEYSSLGDYLAQLNKKKTTSSSSSKTKSPNSSFEEEVKAYKKKQAKESQPTTKLVGGSKKASAKKSQVISSSSESNSEPTSSSSSLGTSAPKPKPGDSKKMIVLHIPEVILTDALASQLIEKEVRFQIVENPAVPNSILFEHSVTYKMVEKDFKVCEKVVKEMDENIILIFPISDHLHLVQNELDGFSDSDSPQSPGETLTEWATKIQNRYKGKKFTLFIQGMEAYLRKVQRTTQKEYKDRLLMSENPDNGKKKRKANQKQGIILSRTEVQSALISLQLNTNFNYKLYENVNDLSVYLTQYIKAVSEALQTKRLEGGKTTDFDWYAVADSVGGIPVEENGKGLRSLWIDQLCQFPHVGKERALAIVRKYGSPQVLYQAYRKCSSVDEGKNLLSEIQIVVGVGPLAKKQRLGPEASRRIYRFFTATKGERQIN